MHGTRRSLALAATALLAACSGDPAATSSGPPDGTEVARCASFDPDCTERLAADTVELRGILFRPDVLTATTGTYVTFSNLDQVDHTVTAGTPDAPDPDRFDEILETAGDTVDLTFDEPGEVAYFCRIHPSTMQGVVVVQ